MPDPGQCVWPNGPSTRVAKLPVLGIRKLPIGIQDFPRIGEEGDLYVDKTQFVIYQSGYLTIQSYNSRHQRYQLGYPNEEVREGEVGVFTLP